MVEMGSSGGLAGAPSLTVGHVGNGMVSWWWWQDIVTVVTRGEQMYDDRGTTTRKLEGGGSRRWRSGRLERVPSSMTRMRWDGVTPAMGGRQ